MVLALLALLALVSKASETLELKNSHNITGIKSEEDTLDFDPIQWTALVAINEFRDRLDIWNATSESLTVSLYTSRLIRDVISSPNGRYMAIVGSDNETSRHTIAIYDTTTWEDTFTGTESPSRWSIDGAWSSDGKRFAAGSQDGQVYIYDTSDWHRLVYLEGPEVAEVTEVEFSSDRTLLAAVIGDYLRVFNLTTSREVWSNYSGDGIARWMPGTHKLLQNLRDVVDGDDNWRLAQRVDGVFGRFHPSGRYLAMGGFQDLIIYNTTDWSHYQQAIYATEIMDMKWGMDGDVLYTYGDSSTIRCWFVVGGALDDQPPSVNMTSPMDGETLKGQVSASGTASDDHGIQYVFLRIDEGPWQLATGTSTWAWTDYPRTVLPGVHALYVRAFDGRFYSATTVIHFTLKDIPVPDLPPRLYLLSPQEEDVVQGYVRVIARAEDENATLAYEVGIDERSVLSFTEGLVWNVTLDLDAVSEGQHRIWARAFDGGYWSDSAEATVQITKPPEPDLRPIVSIAMPTNLEIVYGNVTISGSTFDDHSVDFVVLEDDGRELALIPDAWEWSFVWNTTTVADGYHDITAWAWDGHQRSENTTVMLLIRQPSNYYKSIGVDILRPLPGQQVSDTLVVRIDVSSEPIGYFPERIWLRIDRLSSISMAADANLSMVFDTHLVDNGQHVLYLWVTGYGLSSDEAEVQVTVLNTIQAPNEPPTLHVEYPWQDALIRGTVELKGTATDDHDLLEVALSIDDDAWVRANGGEKWSFQWDSTTVPDGAHRFQIRSFDGDKYSDEVSIRILVDNAQENADSSNNAMSMILFLIILLAIIIAVIYLRFHQTA